MTVRPYLTFQGECREAIGLYERAFDVKADQVMAGSDLPPDPAHPMPEAMRDWIIQATLPLGDTFIRLSDCFGELNAPESERNAIAVECTVAQVQKAFAVLSEGGHVGIPLQQTFFSPCHGVVFDKFGVMWNFVGQ